MTKKKSSHVAGISQQLEYVQEKEVITRIETKETCGAESHDVLVCTVGKRWALLCEVGDGVTLNGYMTLRLDQIRRVVDKAEFLQFAQFQLEALRLRHQLPLSAVPIVDLSSPQAIIKSALHSAPLVTIHQRDYPDECYIGCNPQFQGSAVSFKEITPSATWRTDRRTYDLDDITRIDFGGQYEDALWQVIQTRAADKEIH